MSPRLALTLTAVVLGFAALVALLIPDPGSNAPHAARIVPAAHTAHAGGTGVSAALDADPADAAYLADLFDGQVTDLPTQRVADLVAIGHRICDLGQPRAEWLASLTAGGYTPGEAGKILDTAQAAYCPQRLAETYSGVVTPAPAARPAPAVTRPASAPVTATPAPIAAPAPVAAPQPAPVVEVPVDGVQAPEEMIGGARCPDPAQVVTSIAADGLPICG